MGGTHSACTRREAVAIAGAGGQGQRQGQQQSPCASATGYTHFQVRMTSHSDVCPLRGLTPVTKLLMDLLPIAGVYMALGTAYVWQLCFTEAPQLSRLLRATVLTLLLTYGSVLSITFTLLKCVAVDERVVLMHAGTVECYQPWQWLLGLALALFLLPLPFYIALAVPRLQTGRLTPSEFLTGCPCPLLGCLFLAVHRCRPPQPLSPDAEARLLHLAASLHSPFTRGAQYWQMVYLVRRLTLAALAAFVADPAARLALMCVACAGSLMHHVRVRPFWHPAANSAEGLSLAVQCSAAAVNFARALLVSDGHELPAESTPARVLQWFALFEAGALFAAPAVGVAGAGAALVTGVALRVGGWCRGWWVRGDEEGGEGGMPLMEKWQEVRVTVSVRQCDAHDGPEAASAVLWGDGGGMRDCAAGADVRAADVE